MSKKVTSIQELQIDYKELISSFTTIRKAKFPFLGEVSLIKKKKGGELIYMVKEQTIYSQEDFAQLLGELEILLPLNESKNIIEFYGYSYTKLPTQEEMTVYLVYEYIENSLEKEIQNQGKKNMNLSESFIFKSLLSILQALSYLEEMQLHHGDIRPPNIFITNKREVKIMFTHFNQSSYTQIFETKQKYFKF